MKKRIGLLATFVALCIGIEACETGLIRKFSPEKDLLSLHYDHAPDKDDGQSAAADRTLLESLYGTDWIREHVVAVSGAYGKNADRFNVLSDAVMDEVWGDGGGWIAAHPDHDAAVAGLTARWSKILKAGGDVWVKEGGGQSDITADVVKMIRNISSDVETSKRIHVVQHSDWNEKQTTDADLEYTKASTNYIRIKDANAYLNIKGGDDAFVTAAVGHPVFGAAWKAAFDYYDPGIRLDFSDTGELLHILGLGEMGIGAFRERFLSR